MLSWTRPSNMWVCLGGRSESFLRNRHLRYQKGRLDLDKQAAGSVLQQNPERGKKLLKFWDTEQSDFNYPAWGVSEKTIKKSWTHHPAPHPTHGELVWKLQVH